MIKPTQKNQSVTSQLIYFHQKNPYWMQLGDV